MEISQNVVEYYDELYPVTNDQKSFYADEMSAFPKPHRLLRVGCGTGSFEHMLAKEGADVTGLETSHELIESANRKRRTQLMSLRFFQMNTLEMARFLGKGFYHIISILDGRIILIHDETLIKKFFFDCKQLLAEKGRLIIGLPNFIKFSSVPMAKLPDRQSIRCSLYTQVWADPDDKRTIQLDLETSNGKVSTVMRDVPVFALTVPKIQELAEGTGFTHCDFYGGFDRQPFTEQSDYVIAVIS